MNHIDYYRAVLLGVVIGMSSLTLVYMVGVALNTKTPEEQKVEEWKSKFTAVDTYEGCDIIRWSAPFAAEYKYFLHCPK